MFRVGGVKEECTHEFEMIIEKGVTRQFLIMG
jgi:hypothetical protein